jgi:hypothetical protein
LAFRVQNTFSGVDDDGVPRTLQLVSGARHLSKGMNHGRTIRQRQR